MITIYGMKLVWQTRLVDLTMIDNISRLLPARIFCLPQVCNMYKYLYALTHITSSIIAAQSLALIHRQVCGRGFI